VVPAVAVVAVGAGVDVGAEVGVGVAVAAGVTVGVGDDVAVPVAVGDVVGLPVGITGVSVGATVDVGSMSFCPTIRAEYWLRPLSRAITSHEMPVLSPIPLSVSPA
jgi:hypothetical protein